MSPFGSENVEVMAAKIASVGHADPSVEGSVPTDRLPVKIGTLGPNNEYHSIIIVDTNGANTTGTLKFQAVIAPGVPGAGTPIPGIIATTPGPNANNNYVVEIEVAATVAPGPYDIIVTVQGENPAIINNRIHVQAVP
jgi:hypothetical protein